MGAANVVQSGLRRGPSLRVLALVTVLGAAAATMQLRAHRGDRGHHGQHCGGGHGWSLTGSMAVTPAPVAPAPVAPAPAELAPTPAVTDACTEALNAWAAIRNQPDVPSGTVQQQRVRLRNLAIATCRAPQQP